MGVSGPSIFNARYKIDNGNWDVAIAPSGNPDPVSGLFQLNIGNTASLNNTWLDFEAKFTVGLGYTWTVSNPADPANNITKWYINLVCPCTAAPTCATGTCTLPAPGGMVNNVGPKDSYNVIQLTATARSPTPTTTEVRNLMLTINGADQCGRFADMTAVSTNPLPSTPTTQYIVSDGDLSSTSWTLTGQVKIQGSWTTNPNEANKFDIYTQPFYNQIFTTCQNSACPQV